MESLSPSDMLRLLEDEATRLGEIEQKILNQLHHLQVEENVYEQAIRQLEAEVVADENNAAVEENNNDVDSFAEELEAVLRTTLETETDKSTEEKPSENV